ncbi:MBL fold metallo-hydrolase [Longispora fulva]|uniref:Glyoxylase-like metal-dependent hydrolase (Beta-lactamase superfamily II) n=1 Tax=Longispora fulva TaxID=619741 RepID=A0A8J7KN88_9ACTN|nr:MBL fold metallo-hydrolase [Longispora fulva]MBG6141364.1 glyoxylase-like metal-dependent hydrolase (beta-lactamase superfamily II) [Longispora fulva]GIG59486.1 MBL fold metallo-hydrolase [Longispora fulva]
MAFREIAPGVLVWRYPVLDVNVTLILGGTGAVLVDTLSTPRQAAELEVAVRTVTDLPLTVVNTHAHFDHCFGNASFANCDIWAHEATANRLAENSETLTHRVYERWGSTPGLDGLLDVVVTPPTHQVRTSHTLDIGDRAVHLRHLGLGHSPGDLVVVVDDAVVAGDIVEEGAPPAFDDAYPLSWPDALAALLELCGDGPVVPGHGDVVNREFVERQRKDLATLDWTIREGHADGADVSAIAELALSRWPELGAASALEAVSRGFVELSGRS